MKHTYLILITLLTSLVSFSQVKYEKGYIIDNSGQKTECLIENKDWVYNPESFHYKLTESDASRNGNLATIQEFGVYNFSRYVRAFVQIDKSRSYPVKELSNAWSPEWQTDTLFLRTIVQGKADLYYYEVSKLKKFFFSSPSDSSIRQLVYKQYYTNNTTLRDNVTFRQQLINEARCEMPSDNYFQKLTYDMASLKKHFEKYNQCMGDSTTKSTDKIEKMVQRDLLNFRITPGVNYSSLHLQYSDRYIFPEPDIYLPKKLSYRMGVEIEYIFNFNKNKWGAFIEPSIQYYQAEMDHPGTSYTNFADYKSIELPFGIRYSLFVTNQSKLFFNLIVVPPAVKYLGNSEIGFGKRSNSSGLLFEVQSRTTYGLGVGFNVNNFSVEGRYLLKQGLTGNSTYIVSQYQRLSLVLGYRFFKLRTK